VSLPLLFPPLAIPACSASATTGSLALVRNRRGQTDEDPGLSSRRLEVASRKLIVRPLSVQTGRVSVRLEGGRLGCWPDEIDDPQCRRGTY
jgi:hypothetical protein